MIGSVSLSKLSRGPLQNCSLGNSLDALCQRRGLMHEALQAVVAEALSPAINLHRLQAGVGLESRPESAVPARLGFAVEGLARDALYLGALGSTSAAVCWRVWSIWVTAWLTCTVPCSTRSTLVTIRA